MENGDSHLTNDLVDAALSCIYKAYLLSNGVPGTARLPHRQFLCRGMIEIFLLFSDSKFNKVIPLAV